MTLKLRRVSITHETYVISESDADASRILHSRYGRDVLAEVRDLGTVTASVATSVPDAFANLLPWCTHPDDPDDATCAEWARRTIDADVRETLGRSVENDMAAEHVATALRTWATMTPHVRVPPTVLSTDGSSPEQNLITFHWSSIKHSLRVAVIGDGQRSWTFRPLAGEREGTTIAPDEEFPPRFWECLALANGGRS